MDNTPVVVARRANVMPPHAVETAMCKYCGYSNHEGWDQLLQYDATYQSNREEKENYGFHESWDDLRGQLGADD
jgi:hypothetical protein